MGKFAIITPYYREDRPLIEKCINSVKRQSVSTDHIVISDGVPQDWIDGAGVRHIRLDRSHGDYGNAARGIGALIAIAEEYDGIGFIDCDNWLESDHIAACLTAAGTEEHCDYVIARRTFRRLNGTAMLVTEESDHVDTNCFFFLRGAFSAIPHWGMIPKRLSHSGDRFFYTMIKQRMYVAATVQHPTVNYLCLYASLYTALGETPPPEAKSNVSMNEMVEWLRSLSPREREVASRLTGSDLTLSDDL